MRTQVEIEREMEAIRKQKRREPHMRLYHDALLDKLRIELRGTLGISEKGEAVSKGMLIFFGLMIAIACVGWVAQ